ncbi:MAG: hypothetical protein JHC90_08015 [Ilumatobacteraceae bacterium]|nr:hypothetical protein [Ilumatobacteraceae bacterium]
MFSSKNACSTQRLPLRMASLIVICATLTAGITSCGNEESGAVRNATIATGTTCKSAGEAKTMSGAPYICTTTEAGKVWYPISKQQTWICVKLGATRFMLEGVLSVCGKVKSIRRWYTTLPVALTIKGKVLPTSDPAALELAGESSGTVKKATVADPENTVVVTP